MTVGRRSLISARSGHRPVDRRRSPASGAEPVSFSAAERPTSIAMPRISATPLLGRGYLPLGRADLVGELSLSAAGARPRRPRGGPRFRLHCRLRLGARLRNRLLVSGAGLLRLEFQPRRPSQVLVAAPPGASIAADDARQSDPRHHQVKEPNVIASQNSCGPPPPPPRKRAAQPTGNMAAKSTVRGPLTPDRSRSPQGV